MKLEACQKHYRTFITKIYLFLVKKRLSVRFYNSKLFVFCLKFIFRYYVTPASLRSETLFIWILLLTLSLNNWTLVLVSENVQQWLLLWLYLNKASLRNAELCVLAQKSSFVDNMWVMPWVMDNLGSVLASIVYVNEW